MIPLSSYGVEDEQIEGICGDKQEELARKAR